MAVISFEPEGENPVSIASLVRGSGHTPVLLVLLALWGFVVGGVAQDLPRWQAMDYGPYLTASIEAPEPRTNIAFKGIAINLGANFGGDHNEAVVFDTDLLRYSVGWTGNFVALKGVVFDGEHWAYPRINGTQVFGNPTGPGWAKAGSLADPREFHFGPLPRDWAHWRGLYLYEKKVILSYTVGKMSVLEMPSLEKKGDLAAFARTLNLGPTEVTNVVQVISDKKRSGSLVTVSALTRAGAGVPAQDCLALLSSGLPGETNLLAVALVGGLDGAEWLTTDKGDIRLALPAGSQNVQCKLLVWSGPRSSLPDFAQLVKASPRPQDLGQFTHGGAPRWGQKLETQGTLGTNTGPYVIDTLTEPEPNPWHSWMRFGGIDFFPDGKRAAVCTWNGDVWIVSGIDDTLKKLTWQRIATGLFQPLGLQIVDGEIYVLGRDQITRLHDLNGDGEIDFYENFNNDCMTSEHFHEFALDLKLGPDGNFYYIKCACHGLPASHPHHGTLMRVSRDGSKLEVVARGFRAANGLGVGPHGEFTCIDNQGYWMPANRINWIKPGGWYGNQWAWNPAGRTNYDEPLCWMHNFVDRSGGTQLWVPTDKWGPFQNEIITLSYGMGHMFLLLKESVDGMMQGAVTRFPIEFDTGVMRGVFHPQSGQLYGCGLYGWASNKTKSGGVYRVRYTGQPVHMPCELHFVKDGVVLGFTEPLDAESATDPGNYDVKAWNYQWTINYGSPDFKLNGQEGRDTWPVSSATLSADRKRVFLNIPAVQRVMQLHVVFNLKAADGSEVQNFVHGTIHRLGSRSGLDLLGEGVIARRQEQGIKLAHPAPGLIQSFSLPDDYAAIDTRLARLPATFVSADVSPTPFIEPGRFRCRWFGFIQADLNEDTAFEVEGVGSVMLKINNQVLMDTPGGTLAGIRSRPVTLRRGLNPFELEYQSPTKGDASLRLAWFSKHLPLEPVPPTVFVHDDADPALGQRAQVRDGRQLFADLRCVRCHQPPKDWKTSNAMPELLADAPAFDGIGSRLNPSWIVEWLMNPKKLKSDTSMPRLLVADHAAEQASDIAAYLSTLRDKVPPKARANNVVAPSEAVSAGSKLYAELGCAGCHTLAHDLTLTNESRVSLSSVPRKWQPTALTAYLRSPGSTFHWTRMPDFHLSEQEASELGAFLLQQGPTANPQPSTDRNVAGIGLANANPTHGQELVQSLGCLNCHAPEKKSKGPVAADLTQLASRDWNRGCLSDSAVGRGSAPDYGLTAEQRVQLTAFATQGIISSLERDTQGEFAERQYRALRCQACHSRDTQTDFLTQLAAASPQPQTKDDDFETGKTVHVGRPLLTYAGEKLYAGWMQSFLSGTLAYKPRPELQGRMPAFPAYAAGLANGFAEEHGYRAESAPSSTVDKPLADIGRRLTGVTDGFSCVACHDVGGQKALAGKDTGTVNFACIAERLRPTYYWRYVQDPPHLLPGTMMPKFIGEDGRTQVKSVFDGDPQRQFTAIWNYLLSLRTDSVPK